MDLDVLEPRWSKEYGTFGGDVVLEPKLLSCSMLGNVNFFLLANRVPSIGNKVCVPECCVQVLVCKLQCRSAIGFGCAFKLQRQIGEVRDLTRGTIYATRQSDRKVAVS